MSFLTQEIIYKLALKALVDTPVEAETQGGENPV